MPISKVELACESIITSHQGLNHQQNNTYAGNGKGSDQLVQRASLI